MKRINWKNILTYTLWAICLSGLIASLAFVESVQKDMVCEELHIRINKDDQNYFINKDDIRSILFRKGDSLVGSPTKMINVKELEFLVTENKYVEKASIYADIKGNVQVEVTQRKPVMRVFAHNNRSFYIDTKGAKMPLSRNYSADVLVANGNIDEPYGGIYDSVKTQLVKDLYELCMYISKDDFWNAQIEQIYVKANKDLVLIPRVGNHKIVFGTISDMELKFDNLMIFYKQALPKVGWNTYSEINLKYKGQIVAVRRGVTAPVFVPKNTLKDSTETKMNIDKII